MENQIVVYQPNETMRLDVRVENETVWLNQSRLGELFGVDRTVVNRHINNIYKTGELDAASTCAKIAQVQNEGGRVVCRIAPVNRLTRRHGGTEFSLVAVGLTQRTRREAQRAQMPWRPLRQNLCGLCVENPEGDCTARTRQYPPAEGCPRSGCSGRGARPSRIFLKQDRMQTRNAC